MDENNKEIILSEEENILFHEKIYKYIISNTCFFLSEKQSLFFSDFTGTIDDFKNNKFYHLFELYQLKSSFKKANITKHSNENLDDLILKKGLKFVKNIYRFDHKDFEAFLKNYETRKNSNNNNILIHDNDEYPTLVIFPKNIFNSSTFLEDGVLNKDLAIHKFTNLSNDILVSLKRKNLEQIISFKDMNKNDGVFLLYKISLDIQYLFDYMEPEKAPLVINDITETFNHEMIHFYDYYACSQMFEFKKEIYERYYETIPTFRDEKEEEEFFFNRNALLDSFYLSQITITSPQLKNVLNENSYLQQFFKCIDDFYKFENSYTLPEYSKDLEKYLHQFMKLIGKSNKINELLNLRKEYFDYLSNGNLPHKDEEQSTLLKSNKNIEIYFHEKFEHLVSFSVDKFKIEDNGDMEKRINEWIQDLILAIKYNFSNKTIQPNFSLYFLFSSLLDTLNGNRYYSLEEEMLAYTASGHREEILGYAIGKEKEVFFKKSNNAIKALIDFLPPISLNQICLEYDKTAKDIQYHTSQILQEKEYFKNKNNKKLKTNRI